MVVLVVLLTSDERVMREHVNSPGLRNLGWLTAILLFAAAIMLLLSACGMLA
jgi:Mn2+/Fe2+ NRAMP family transporter